MPIKRCFSFSPGNIFHCLACDNNKTIIHHNIFFLLFLCNIFVAGVSTDGKGICAPNAFLIQAVLMATATRPGNAFVKQTGEVYSATKVSYLG